jgi:diaphanous 1
MKETKTAKGDVDCPTLLHYLARVLLRTEPSIVLFHEDLPNLEPAARGMCPQQLLLPVVTQVSDNSIGTNDYSSCKCSSLGPWTG